MDDESLRGPEPPESPATPVASATPVAPAPAERGVEPLTFTGSGAEYFRIWIVNIALTLLTLGIYSAWAKVRRLQYFYRHTRLAGAGFDYHADPRAILRGRIVGLILLAAYSMSGYVSPLMTVGVLGVIGAIMPFLLARSFRFRFYNSSYRGLRFRFTGGLGEAYWVFLGLPVLTLFTLGLLGPLWHSRMKRYQHAHAAYGKSGFGYEAPDGDFYITYVAAIAMFFGSIFVLILATIAFGVMLAVLAGAGGEPPPTGGVDFGPGGIAIVVGAMLGYLAILTFVQSFVTARIQNLVWNHTRLGQHRFLLQLGTPRLFLVNFSNLVATIATLGLYRPFAQVRLMKYITGEFTMLPLGTLDDFAAAEPQDIGAVGEETAELFDFDIAF